MGKVSKRQIEKALLRALQDNKHLEEFESELLLHGGSLNRLKKQRKKQEPDPPMVEEEEANDDGSSGVPEKLN